MEMHDSAMDKAMKEHPANGSAEDMMDMSKMDTEMKRMEKKKGMMNEADNSGNY